VYGALKNTRALRDRTADEINEHVEQVIAPFISFLPPSTPLNENEAKDETLQQVDAYVAQHLEGIYIKIITITAYQLGGYPRKFLIRFPPPPPLLFFFFF
jgi:hypothetical protein